MRLFGRREGAGPVASYAAVLDGAHLWLDLEVEVTLRDADSGVSAAPERSPVPLAALTGDHYDVVADGHAVLLTTPLPDRAPARTPLAPDGVSQWGVVRDDDGRLALTRHRVVPTAVLDAVDLRDDRVHLRLSAASGPLLLLLDADDRVLTTLHVTAQDGGVEVQVGDDDLPAAYVGMLRLAVGTEADHRRIRRRDNGLADPNHGTLLPELMRARFRWSPEGLLVVRALEREQEPS